MKIFQKQYSASKPLCTNLVNMLPFWFLLIYWNSCTTSFNNLEFRDEVQKCFIFAKAPNSTKSLSTNSENWRLTAFTEELIFVSPKVPSLSWRYHAQILRIKTWDIKCSRCTHPENLETNRNAIKKLEYFRQFGKCKCRFDGICSKKALVLEKGMRFKLWILLLSSYDSIKC